MNKKILWAPDKRKLPDEYYEELRDYTEEENQRIKKEGDFLIIDDDRYIPSLNNPNALLLYDKGHHEILDFPLCPKIVGENPLITYFNNLEIGKNLIEGYCVPFIIVSYAFNPEKTELWIRCKQNLGYEACEHVLITSQDGYYIHFIDTFYPHYDIDDEGKQKFYWPWEEK